MLSHLVKFIHHIPSLGEVYSPCSCTWWSLFTMFMHLVKFIPHVHAFNEYYSWSTLALQLYFSTLSWWFIKCINNIHEVHKHILSQNSAICCSRTLVNVLVNFVDELHVKSSWTIRWGMQVTHSHCSRMAQHALVLGSSGHVQPDPSEHAQPVNTALQSDPSQKSDKPKSSCMAPRASAIKEQGFSEAVAARIEAPQRGSTRSVYEAKWAIFTKWCFTNQVDFRAPPVKSVADFLMYLFRTGSYSPVPLMDTGKPLLINLEICPLILARMIISLVSRIVSTETDPKEGGEFPPRTSPWFCTSWQRLHLNQLKRPRWSIWPSRQFFS